MNFYYIRKHYIDHSMSAKRILHYGIQRSGTNFLKEVIQGNFDIEIINKEFERAHPAHKHFRIYDNKTLIGRPKYMNTLLIPHFDDFEKQLGPEWKADGYIVVSKDPYSWNISYANWGKKHKWTSQAHSYMSEYNEYYNKWLQLAEESDKIMLVRYVDLLIDNEQFLQQLKKQFSFVTRDTKKVKKVKKVPYSQRFTKKRLRYYTNEEYMAAYSDSERKELNESIDHNLMEKLGYKSYF
jgi:hypothetical protein